MRARLGLVALAALLSAGACGPGDLDAYREGRPETPTPTAPPMAAAHDVFVYAFPATPTPTPTATATPTATPTPEPTPTPTPPPPPPPTAPPAAAAAAPPPGGPGPVSSLDQCGKSYPSDVVRWSTVAAQYGWNLCEWANIVDCESDGLEWIVNPYSGACGVMQHLPCQALGDGAGSIALGWAKYSSRGWQPWTVGGCYPY